MGKFHACLRMPPPENREHLLEVQLLPSIRHVNHLMGVPGHQTMLQCCQISGRVIECAVTLLNQGRSVLKSGDILKKNDDRPFTFLGDSLVAQFLHQSLQSWIVKTLTKPMIELYPQAIINRFELLFRKCNHLEPDAQ